MFGLQQEFDDIIESQLLVKLIICNYIEEKLKKEKIILTDEQSNNIDIQIKDDSLQVNLNFDISNEQLSDSIYESEEDLKPILNKIINGLDEHINIKLKNIDSIMQDTIDGMKDTLTTEIYESMGSTFNEMIQNQEILEKDFSVELLEIWESPISILQGIIVISEEFINAYHEDQTSDTDLDLLKNVLIHLHAKAIKTSKEIITLLKKGFADGADARWRTLHEITVISLFIVKYGDIAAERFFYHNDIELYKASIQYNNYYSRIGVTRIPKNKIEELSIIKESLLEKYGKDFKNNYGWASIFTPKSNPNFRDLEENVELDHYRPYYKSASSNVHSNPHGVFSSLGLLDEDNIILGGASSLGLSQPLHSTAISLLQVSTAIMKNLPTLDTIVTCNIISRYIDKLETEINLSELKVKKIMGIKIRTFRRIKKKQLKRIKLR